MDAYEICTGCSRHVKTVERRCPFCAAPRKARAARRVLLPRASRARWLAIGSTIALGCTGAVESGGPGVDGGEHADAAPPDAAPPDAAQYPDGSSVRPDGSARDGASDAGTVDAARDAAVDAPGEGGVCGNRPGQVWCYATPCNEQTEYCSVNSHQCEALVGAGSLVPSECASCPTCDCINAHAGVATCCQQDPDGGGITLGCGGCYGSPPARRTRSRRAVRRPARRHDYAVA